MVKITIKISGKCVVRFEEKGTGNEQENEENSGSKIKEKTSTIINRTTELVSSVDNVMIEKGEYEYPFAFELPADVPASMASVIFFSAVTVCLSAVMLTSKRFWIGD